MTDQLKTLLLLLALLLVGCRASNDEIIQETKRCLDAGMAVLQDEFGFIVCVPRKEQKP